MPRKKRYYVWSDSESYVDCYEEFSRLDDACEFASQFVHQYDNADYRVTVHVEDRRLDDAVDSYDNIMVGDLCYPVTD